MENTTQYGEGLYFGMPDEVYHSLPMLSASGLKNLLISPVDFYYRSWLNVNKQEREDTEAMIIGRAYHKRILEGRRAFYDSYCAEFEAQDGCLRTIEDLKIALSSVGVSGESKWKKPDWIRACQSYLPDAKILDVEKQRYDEMTNGKTQLSALLIERIEIAAAMIEKHPQLGKCITGGFPEVTVIWQSEDLWFKARFDYLKPRAIIDLKTFTNAQNKPVDAAIYGAMANQKYHIQAAHYLNAAGRASGFAKTGEVFGGNPSAEWLEALSETEEHDFYFLFQQKGTAPLARGKKFGRGSMFACGQVSIQKAVELFRQYYAVYGDGVWVDNEDITAFDDTLFPPWSVEI